MHYSNNFADLRQNRETNKSNEHLHQFLIVFLSPSIQQGMHMEDKNDQGPRAGVKQKQPEAWSSGIIPPPLVVSIASNILTTSSISGRLSAFASQHFRIILAKELGQHLGISGRRFCQ